MMMIMALLMRRTLIMITIATTANNFTMILALIAMVMMMVMAMMMSMPIGVIVAVIMIVRLVVGSTMIVTQGNASGNDNCGVDHNGTDTCSGHDNMCW